MSGCSIDLSFTMSSAHRKLLADILTQSLADEEVMGVLLIGSVARGDALPGSDLDLFLLLRDGCSREFHSETRDGIMVERKYADRARAQSRLEQKPMEVYSYLDGRILYDPQGGLRELVECARHRYETHRVPTQEKQYLAYCLRSAGVKLRATSRAGDELKAGCAVAMGSWFIVEGLWAVNDKPAPPGGAVLALAGKLDRQPPDGENWQRRFFAGDCGMRVQAALEIIDWLLSRLESA